MPNNLQKAIFVLANWADVADTLCVAAMEEGDEKEVSEQSEVAEQCRQAIRVLGSQPK